MTIEERRDYDARVKAAIYESGMNLESILQFIPPQIKLIYAVCRDRKEGRSLQMIANNHKVSKSTVERHCKKCCDLPDL